VERGIVEGLLDMNVDGAGDMLDLRGKFLRNCVVADLILTHDLDIHGRGHPEIQDLRDDVGRLEEKLR